MAAADLRIGFEDLRTFVRGVLLKEGLNADDTEAVTDGVLLHGYCDADSALTGFMQGCARRRFVGLTPMGSPCLSTTSPTCAAVA